MIQVIYLDLGKVIIDFDYSVAVKQIVERTPFSPEQVTAVLSDACLISEYETGRMSTEDHYRKVCEMLRMDVSMEQFRELWGSMFLPEPLLSEVLLQVLSRRYRLILLSNTNEIHFQYVAEKYSILQYIPDRVLSYQVGCMKPDPKIFQFAIEKAGVAPKEIFFADDRAENIEAAQQAGIQAHQFHSEAIMKEDMIRVGIDLGDSI